MAVINGDGTDVGYVHFGVVHILRVPNEKIVGRRSGIVRPEFIPITDAVKAGAQYESWSRLCLDHLDSLLAKAAPAAIRPS